MLFTFSRTAAIVLSHSGAANTVSIISTISRGFDDEFFEDEETAGTKEDEAKDKKEDSDEETEE